jgi:endonuclease-3
MKAETILAEDWHPPRPDRVHRIRDRLRELYGRPNAEPHGHPIAELILTVLSQSTNDRNRDVAYFGLHERFSDWAAVRDAPVDEVEEAIRPGGISKVKSARIKSILAAIASPDDLRGAQAGSRTTRARPERARLDAERAVSSSGGRAGAKRKGEPSLDWLAEVSVAEAQEYLCSLPGVGRKTAACVLLFALGMRDVPVDTHVSRVGMRLHLLRPGAPFEELHDEMLALTPAGEELELHINLLRHGRRTCHARRPECSGCALARMCPSAGSF